MWLGVGSCFYDFKLNKYRNPQVPFFARQSMASASLYISKPTQYTETMDCRTHVSFLVTGREDDKPAYLCRTDPEPGQAPAVGRHFVGWQDITSINIPLSLERWSCLLTL